MNLDKREWSYKKWMVIGIFCCHLLSAMKFLNLNEVEFILNCFKKKTYETVYAQIIYPINNQHLWEITSWHDVLPPPKKRLPERPKKNRRLEPWELKKDNT